MSKQLTKEKAAGRIAGVLKRDLDKTGLLVIIKHFVKGDYRNQKESTFFGDGLMISPEIIQEQTYGVNSHKNGLCTLSGQMYAGIALTNGYLPDPCAGQPQEDGTTADDYCFVESVSASALLAADGFPVGSTDAITKVSDPWDSDVRPRRLIEEDARDVCPYQMPTYVAYVDITKGWLNASVYRNPMHIAFCLPVNELTGSSLPQEVEDITGSLIAQAA